jgi:hypothetical protein
MKKDFILIFTVVQMLGNQALAQEYKEKIEKLSIMEKGIRGLI